MWGREGRTVVFISHNMVAVESLCDRAVWLEKGAVVRDGAAGEVVAAYSRQSSSAVVAKEWLVRSEAPGDDHVRLRSARIYPVEGHPGDQVTIRTPVKVAVDYWNLDEGARLNLSVVLWNDEGVVVFNTASILEPSWHGKEFPKGLFRSDFVIPGDLLNSGSYRVELYVVRDEASVLFRDESLLSFEVEDAVEMRGSWHAKWHGAVRPNLPWHTQLVEAISE